MGAMRESVEISPRCRDARSQRGSEDGRKKEHRNRLCGAGCCGLVRVCAGVRCSARNKAPCPPRSNKQRSTKPAKRSDGPQGRVAPVLPFESVAELLRRHRCGRNAIRLAGPDVPNVLLPERFAVLWPVLGLELATHSRAGDARSVAEPLAIGPRADAASPGSDSEGGTVSARFGAFRIDNGPLGSHTCACRRRMSTRERSEPWM